VRAAVVTALGGPDVIEAADLPEPSPAAGEALVEVAAAGVNFIDTYHRTGLYPMEVPFVPGLEGSGRVVAVGDGVDASLVGSRVAWASALGSYAEMVTAPADRLVPVPDGVGDAAAAAVMLQGLTAHYLVNDTFPLAAGHRCLIHAAAGGVGGLLVQLAKAKGAEVFATAGGPGKVALAAEAGADHAIDYRAGSFRAAIEEIAGPRPLHVVYDGVGAATFDDGLDLLAPRGLMVAFGNASGPPAPLDILRLSRGGSLYVTRPTLGTYTATPEVLRARAADLFAAIAAGTLAVRIGERFPLDEASAAHEALEGRRTVGKVLIEP